MLSVSLLLPQNWRLVDERLGQLAWKIVREPAPERRVLAVDLDERSLAEVGAWPWPRERVATLIDRIDAAGAGVIMLDIVFVDARRDDAALARAVREHAVVLAQVFALAESGPRSQGQLRGASGECFGPEPDGRSYLANASSLGDVPAGHIAPVIDGDGTVRHLPPLLCHEGLAYPTLTLAGLAAAAGVPPRWRLEAGGGWLGPRYWLAHPDIPGIRVPVAADGLARVSYRRPREAFEGISAASLLEPGANPADLPQLAGAWVLVGATAFGMGDAVPTPLSGLSSGLEVHMQFLSALLDGALPYAPRATPALVLAEGLLAGLVLVAIAGGGGRRTASWLLLAGAGLAAASLAAHAVALSLQHWWLGWLGVPAFALLSAVLLAAWAQWRSARGRELLMTRFASVMPASAVEALAAGGDDVEAIDAAEREITVLFADIHGFSAFTEGMPAETVGRFLQGFFQGAARIVNKHGGTVDKFIGDAVMALWNAADDEPDHVRRALAAARELQTFGERYLGAAAPWGTRPIGLGIGLESGIALVGLFGGRERRTYTALGAPVTVAAKLETLTRTLGRGVLVGEGAAARAGAGARLEPLGRHALAGLLRPYGVYGLGGPREAMGAAVA